MLAIYDFMVTQMDMSLILSPLFGFQHGGQVFADAYLGRH